MATQILHGHVIDVLATLPEKHWHCVVSSPPFYGLRSYGTEPQIWGGTDPDCQHEWNDATAVISGGGYSDKSTLAGFTSPDTKGRTMNESDKRVRSSLCRKCSAWKGELGGENLPDCLGWARGEPPESCTQACFLCHLRLVMAGLRRVLRDDGLCFVELGDGYSTNGHGPNPGRGHEHVGHAAYAKGTGRGKGGIPAKSLLLVPERFRLAMLSDGWVVRSVIRWAKKAPMPESCRDRFTSAVSEVVMLSKGSRYYSDFEAVKERASSNLADGRRGDGAGYAFKPTAPVTHMGVPESGRNPRNYALLDPDDLSWLPTDDEDWKEMLRQLLAGLAGQGDIPPDWVHLSPEPSKLSHYASFGPKAISPFLKLATSQAGCCPNCSAAWERVTERTSRYEGKSTMPYLSESHTARHAAQVNGNSSLPQADVRTTGWSPRCTCGLPESSNVPCRTLDCFGGSGTVGVVSEKLGLDCTLIDLSPDYVGMSALRLQLEGAPLFANGNGHDERAGGLEQAVMALGDGR